MDKDKVTHSSFEVFIEEGKSTSLRDVIGKYLFHWPLFLLFILISFLLAFAYLNLATPGYTVKARLLINDDEKGSGSEGSLKELQLFTASTLVENELELLKSRSLMSNVVKDLDLSVQYLVEDGFRYKDLYTESPVRLNLLKAGKFSKPQVIEIVINDADSFTLKGKESDVKVSYASRLTNRLGTWRLDPETNLSEYAGKKLKIIVTNPDAVTDSYVARLNADLPNKNATVVELSIKESVPERGRDILNKLIAAYNHEAVNDKNKVRDSALDLINARLSSLKGELNAVEKNVESFKSSKGLMDISSESKFFLDNVKDNDAKLNEVNVQLEIVNSIERHVNSASTSGRVPATTGIEDQGLVALINQLMTLELKRDQLMDTAPEGSPVFDAVDRQIASTKRSIRENIRGIKSSLLASRNQLRSNNSGFEASIKQLPGQEREIVNIQRQQKIKEDLYVYLLQKREEAAVNYASTLVDSKTVDQAHFGEPDSPNKMIAYGFSLIAGIMIPFCLILGREIMNNRVLTVREIQDRTSAPVLAELAYQKSASALVLTDKSRRMIAEQFRSLRTNLQYLYENAEAGRVTLLTSGMAGEGKSFVTSNLGAALAASGRKTIILELDLRSPKISKYLNLQPSMGISDYLQDKCYIEEIIQPSGFHENLFVASAGSLPEYPAELLVNDRMEELINWLCNHFDEVLIDTPPIKLVTDAMILSRFSDVNLFIVRHGYTHKSQLDFIKQLFAEQKMKNLNIIFNGVDVVGQAGAYEYGYYANETMSSKDAFQAGFRDLLKRF